MFETVILMMTVLVLFFVPGLTVGRDRRRAGTPDPGDAAGHDAADALDPVRQGRGRAVFLLLMIVAALPVLAVSYLLGGIRLVDIGMGVLAVFIVALLVATMVVAVSSFAKRVQTATLLAYGFTALLSFIGPLVYGILMLLDNRSTTDENAAPAWIATVNPFALVADLGSGNRASGDGPLSAHPRAARRDQGAQRQQLVGVVPEAGQLLRRRRGPLRRPSARRRPGGVGAVDGVAVADRRRRWCSSRSAASAPRPKRSGERVNVSDLGRLGALLRAVRRRLRLAWALDTVQLLAPVVAVAALVLVGWAWITPRSWSWAAIPGERIAVGIAVAVLVVIVVLALGVPAPGPARGHGPPTAACARRMRSRPPSRCRPTYRRSATRSASARVRLAAAAPRRARWRCPGGAARSSSPRRSRR